MFLDFFCRFVIIRHNNNNNNNNNDNNEIKMIFFREIVKNFICENFLTKDKISVFTKLITFLEAKIQQNVLFYLHSHNQKDQELIDS